MNRDQYVAELESTLDELADYVERQRYAFREHWCGFCALGQMWARSHCHRCGDRVAFPNEAMLCEPCLFQMDDDHWADQLSSHL